MQFWKNDRRDDGFEMPVSEVADLYVKSKYADSEAYDWPLTRSVAAFLEDSDGPIAAAFDPNSAAFDELIHEVYVREFTRECHSDAW